MKLTESQFRNLIRMEVKKLLEAKYIDPDELDDSQGIPASKEYATTTNLMNDIVTDLKQYQMISNVERTGDVVSFEADGRWFVKEEDFSADIHRDDDVLDGPFDSYEEAERAADDLERQGFENLVIDQTNPSYIEVKVREKNLNLYPARIVRDGEDVGVGYRARNVSSGDTDRFVRGLLGYLNIYSPF